MDKQEFIEYILNNYNTDEEHPWVKFPDYAVFRHRHNKKWFALVSDIPCSKLGLKSNESVSVVNLKCGPVLVGSLIGKAGYYPAYHMNKSNWVSLTLNGDVPDDEIKTMLDISYDMTK